MCGERAGHAIEPHRSIQRLGNYLLKNSLTGLQKRGGHKPFKTTALFNSISHHFLVYQYQCVNMKL